MSPARCATISLALLVGVAGARADTVWLSGPGGEDAGKLTGVTVTRVAGGKVYFRNGGAEGSRATSQVRRLAMEDEPALSAAELAYVGGKYDAAADGYARFLGATARDDLKAYVGARLVDAASRAGRLEAAVAGYVAIVECDVAWAGEHRLTAGAAKAGVIDAAVLALDAALAVSRPAAQRVALFWAKVDLLRARGDGAKVAVTLERLIATARGAGASDGGAAELLGEVRLAQASVAVEAGNGAAAEAIIDGSRATFLTAGQQAEALFVLARARELQAITPEAKLDAALAYMRVPAHFPDGARAAPATLAAAGLLASAGDVEGARELYASLAGSSVGEQAGKGLATVNR